MPRKKVSGKAQVVAFRHQDSRTNIPTEELRDFVSSDEHAPKTLLYPRDPSLDPQLVWQGKDEQDRVDLAVPAVPIYIQEKIHPQVLIDDLLAHAQAANDSISETDSAYQLNMFSDFNGLPEEFDQRVEFYKHEGHWSNRMILGDSLMVMASLAEKEGLKSKVQMIYIDPPYGIKFGSNWQVSTRKRDVKDGKAEDATRQPEQVRAYRDTWKLGIHSYLAYLRDRLIIARDLLTDSGSVFVQIGEENVHLVRCVLDEIYGSENFCREISFVTTSGFRTKLLSRQNDYLLWYAKNIENVKFRPVFRVKPYGSDDFLVYNKIELPNGKRRVMSKDEISNPSILPLNSQIFRIDNLKSQGSSGFDFKFLNKFYNPGQNNTWKTTLQGMERLAFANRISKAGSTLGYIRYYEDFPVEEVKNIWTDTITGSFTGKKIFVVQTNTKVIERCLLMTTDPGDLVLDPTCGSGTTAFVAEQWGRRWITCDTSRVALALARTRLMAAKYQYYYLADDYPIIAPEATDGEINEGLRKPSAPGSLKDLRKGFIYQRVPHVTLKSIANNPDIHEGMTPKEIDTAIMRHANSETLFDKPYEDNKRVRVSGPFTVESLSPHRILDTADENLDGAVSQLEAQREQDFSTIILDNLRASGVQNTIKKERIKFDMLEPFAGRWLQAKGEYSDVSGKSKRVAVSIGPEHGTVSPQQVKEAAKEAVQGIGFDLLLVCGFAFDPHVAEEAKRYGELMVLPTNMNPDLSMSDELLKKTGSGNLFMIFGEPDIVITQQPTGELVIEINGVDVYDPTTGEIRSASTDDISCWFVDTNYNGESFFVRHAYFTGTEEPYNKLKRALRADVDEGAWSALYSTVSRPFVKPMSGKIAVKVINHYGDEVLKVFEV